MLNEHDESLSRRSTLPLDNPLSRLPMTPRKIMEAARRLLAEQGYQGVTMHKVAAAAGVDKSSIRYHFGNKSELVGVLVDALMHEEFVRASVACTNQSRPERLHSVIEAKRRLILADVDFRGFFDILPHAIRDDDLRERIAGLYQSWCEQNLVHLGLASGGPASRPESLTGLGRLFSAVTGGLSIQHAVDPSFDPGAALQMLELLVGNYLNVLIDLADNSGDTRTAGDRTS